MTLREFILSHPDPILAEWVRFARSLGVGAGMTRLSLLNHSAELLLAIAADMAERQNSAERQAKSEGLADNDKTPTSIEEVSTFHAESRVDSGFDLLQVIAEYRALRSSVIELWRKSAPATQKGDVEEVGRFNEAIDQALAEAVRAFTARVRRSSDLFLAILGHDMRGPLHSISMLAQLAATEPRDPVQLGESTSQIVATVKSAATLLDDLLLFTSTRLGAGLPLTRKRIAVDVLCAEAIAEVKGAYPSAPIRLTHREHAGAEHSKDRFVGEFDGARLRQAVTNLVRNAVQHGHATKEILVSVDAGPTILKLSVHNFGTSIPADLLPTIFDPLVRGHSLNASPLRRAGSVGLGLYIVREVIAAHGGSVGVKSSERTGTTFTIELPLRAPQSVASSTVH